MAVSVERLPNWLLSHENLEKTHTIQDLLYPTRSVPQGPKLWFDPIWNSKQGS